MNGRGQEVWGWPVAAYLFVAGTGAGAYAVGAFADWLGAPGLVLAALPLGPLLVGPATLFLIADLGRPGGFMRAARRPGSSWIARGAIVLTAFLAASALHTLCVLLDGPAAARVVVSVAGGALALLTMAYTGLLLGAVRPIPFWTTPILPVLFVVSSLSTGAMAADLVATVAGRAERALAVLRAADLGLIAVEAAVLALYLGLGHATAASRAATALVVRGALARPFWGGVVAAGLAVPFAIQLAEVTAAVPASGLWTVASAAAGLAGGYALRRIVIAAGVKTPLSAAGMVFTFPLPQPHAGRV